MNFDFSDDQKFLKDQANKFLSEKCDTSVARAVLEGDAAYDEGLWKAIVEMGWTGITIPEEYGGLGLGHLELCVIAEEMGRALAPVPFSSTVYLATEALLLAGSDEQKKNYLPKLASGELIGTFALAEGAKVPTPRSLEAKISGGKISGTKIPVPDGDIADFAVVAAVTDSSGSESAVALSVVDLNDKSVSREAVKTIDPSRSHATITFKDTPAEALGESDAGWSLTRQLFDRAAVLFAFEQVGGSDRCLEIAKEYALSRYAFGRQIGSFQAIKHKLADMYIKNQLARSNAYYGAWALSTDAPELPVAAAGARISATQAYDFASKEMIQTHGGIGFTWEMDCHLFLRRAQLLGLCVGGARGWKDRLISALERRNAA